MSPLQSATLERLSLNDMIQKSTAIVRGTVTGSHVAQQGALIYTHYTVHVTERFKGPPRPVWILWSPGAHLTTYGRASPARLRSAPATTTCSSYGPGLAG